MTRKERFEACTAYCQKAMPEAETELTFSNTYELLVAVILSAQCTDKRVIMTTRALFRKDHKIPQLAKVQYDEVFELIKSISFPGNKSVHLIGMANMVMEKFNGELPMTVEELVQLPGVGRKTA